MPARWSTLFAMVPRRRCAGLAIALLLSAVSSSTAHASGANYVGGCGLFAQQSDWLDGPGMWHGEVDAEVQSWPNDVLSPVTVECQMWTDHGWIADFSTSGTGLAATAQEVRFAANVGDAVHVTEIVTTSYGTEYRQYDLALTGFVPQQVNDALGTAVGALGVVGPVVSLLFGVPCIAGGASAPVVNGLGHPNVVYVDDRGQVNLLGSPEYYC